MPTLSEYTEQEMRLAGYTGNNKKRLQLCLLQLIQTFEAQRWGAFETKFIVDLFSKLTQFQPISPLTGEDWEWVSYNENTLQNTRCHTVFKEVDSGQAFDTHSHLYRDAAGHCTPNPALTSYIQFPYTPKTEYVNVTTKTVTLPPRPEDNNESK